MNDIYRAEQLKALQAVLIGSEAYFYRRVCRWYSNEFHTPLKDVEILPYEHILQHYYENKLEAMGRNQIIDIAIYDFLPKLRDNVEEEEERFAESLIEEQNESLRKKAEKERLAKEATETGEKSQSLNSKVSKEINAKPKPKGMNLDFGNSDDPEEP